MEELADDGDPPTPRRVSWSSLWTWWTITGAEAESLEKRKASWCWLADVPLGETEREDGASPTDFHSSRATGTTCEGLPSSFRLGRHLCHLLHPFPPTWIKDPYLLSLHIPRVLLLLQKGDQIRLWHSETCLIEKPNMHIAGESFNPHCAQQRRENIAEF